MDPMLSLKIIFGISILGLLFSGYLSYTEIFKQTRTLGSCTSVAKIPVCVYGFFMYLLVLIISLLGIFGSK